MKVTTLDDFPWKAQRIGNRFRNLRSGAVRGWREALRWKLGLGPKESPARGGTLPFAPDMARPDFAAIRHPNPGRITATWCGHSTFLLQLGGRSFLTDPNGSLSCPPVPLLGFRRLSQPGFSVAELPPIDAVLLSHDHYDHTDRPTLLALGRHTRVICPIGLGSLLENWKFGAATELSWGETVNCDGVQLTCLPAQHGSGRSLLDRNRSLWCSWLLQSGGQKILFLGDTGYAPFFAELGRRFGPVDLALIPIGAYRPFWFMHPLHVQPLEAVQLHLDLQAKRSLAMHWGTFALADEPLGEPPLLLKQALLVHTVAPDAFQLLRFGETVQI